MGANRTKIDFLEASVQKIKEIVPNQATLIVNDETGAHLQDIQYVMVPRIMTVKDSLMKGDTILDIRWLESARNKSILTAVDTIHLEQVKKMSIQVALLKIK